MPIFNDIKFDPESGRHEFYFVNQQYDYLMIIAYDDVQKIYRAHLPPGGTTRSLGENFDLDYWLKEAEKLCLEADEKLLNKPQGPV